MKKLLLWICLAVFLFLCVCTMWFLQLFTEADMSAQYIDWQSSVKINADNSETEPDYSKPPEKGDRFRLETVIPANDEYGNLIFETAGLALTVSINGEKVWESVASVPKDAANQTQAVIPLPPDTECHLTMLCQITNTEALVFPPLPRFVPVDAAMIDSYAYANYYGIPAGATAFISLMIAGLFLITLLRRNPNLSLIPLFITAAGLTMQWITKGMGHYFVNDGFVDLLNRHEFSFLFIASLVVYIIMNRRRRFLKYFGIFSAASAAALLIACFISAVSDGYLSAYVRELFTEITEYGLYDNLVYWITVWFTTICAAISLYSIMDSFIAQQLKAKELQLHNKMVMDSYLAIKSKMIKNAAIRHEANHRLIALDSLYKKQEYDALGKMLEEMKQQSISFAKTQFTENFTVNAILQDASHRAAQADIRFDAYAAVPASLAVTEQDLCELLMNMLDNAIEAAAACDPSDRFIRFHIEEKNDFVAIKCENSCTGDLKQDRYGKFITTKEEPETHGFGLKIMNSIAQKHNSILDISISDNCIFTVQTALKLPKHN